MLMFQKDTLHTHCIFPDFKSTQVKLRGENSTTCAIALSSHQNQTCRGDSVTNLEKIERVELSDNSARGCNGSIQTLENCMGHFVLFHKNL